MRAAANGKLGSSGGTRTSATVTAASSEVRLPNGRTFSFSLGHLLLAGLLLLWLPSNWVIFAIVLSIAWHYGLFSSSHAADEKPKRKNDEPLPSDDVVEF
ncbi:MAG: hypothetical protein HND48_23575 [Chloroflexi bacterium]|nr:hypothetical protein [Chloroflexota bacterium]